MACLLCRLFLAYLNLVVEEDIFVEENIEEIYLDFPNEVDEKTYNEL